MLPCPRAHCGGRLFVDDEGVRSCMLCGRSPTRRNRAGPRPRRAPQTLPEGLIGVGELARTLGRPWTSVRREITRREIPIVRVGRLVAVEYRWLHRLAGWGA